MATYYFTNFDNDTDWDNPDNWYDAATGGNALNSIPTGSDDVIIVADVALTGGSPVANSLTVDTSGLVRNITVTVGGGTGTCTVQNGGIIGESCTINGNVICGTGGIIGHNYNVANINGTLTFQSTGATEAGTMAAANVSGDVNINSDSSGSITYVTLGGDLNYYYGYSGSVSNMTVTGSTLYFNYPTLYFYNSMDTDWGTATNWWVDSGHSQQAGSIPDNTQDVILHSDVASDSSTTATANNMTVSTPGMGSRYINISVTVVGTSTFQQDTYYGDGTASVTLTCPSVVMNDNSYLNTNSSVVGDVNFYGTSAHVGSITGNVTVYSPHAVPFNSSNGNNGTISGTISYSGYPSRTVYFYHTDSNLSGRDWGDANSWYTSSGGSNPATYVPNGIISKDNVIIESSISGNTSNIDTTVGSLVVNDHPSAYSTYILSGMSITCDYANFNDSSVNRGTIVQSSNHGGNSIIFNDLSNNDTSGTVEPYTADNVPVEFRDGSSNDGTIDGDAEVYYPSEKPIGGTVNGIVTYFGYTLYFGGMSNDGNWNNPNNWYLDQAHSSAYNDIPSDIIPYQDVILQYNVSVSNQPPYPGSIGGTPSAYDLLCSNGIGIQNITIVVSNLATFSGANSYLNFDATIDGNALIKDTSFIAGGTITGTATFTLSAAKVMIIDAYSGTYGDVEFQYEKGINGSSILGLV